MTHDFLSDGAIAAPPPRPAVQSIMRGLRETCPNCGKGGLYRRYLKIVDRCSACGEDLHHHRADDAPPYFVILIVGHIIVAGVLLLEELAAPPTWVHAVVWGPLILLVSLLLLPRVKGALVGLQWALRMHGFGGEEDQPEEEPRAVPARADTRP